MQLFPSSVVRCAWLCYAEWGGDDAYMFPKTLEQRQGVLYFGSKYQYPQRSCLLRQQNPVSWLAAAGMCGNASLQTHASRSLSGLLRGDTLPDRDGHPGATSPADPTVVTASDLPPGLCAEGPGPHESQVSGGMHHKRTARLVLLRCQAAHGLWSCRAGSPAMSAQIHDDGCPCVPALGSQRGLAAP